MYAAAFDDVLHSITLYTALEQHVIDAGQERNAE